MKVLKYNKVWLVMAAMMWILALPASTKEKKAAPEKVKLDECPAAVQKTIKDNSEGGEIIKIEKATDKGGVVYETEVKKSDGKRIDIDVAADGKLIKVEEVKAKHK